MIFTINLAIEDAIQLREDVKANAGCYDDARGIAAQIGNAIQDEECE